jgi:hypothetical protein
MSEASELGVLYTEHSGLRAMTLPHRCGRTEARARGRDGRGIALNPDARPEYWLDRSSASLKPRRGGQSHAARNCRTAHYGALQGDTGDIQLCQRGCHAPGPGKERVWLKVYSPSRRSTPVSSKVTRRAITLCVGAAFAKVIDS